ncbi:Os11g0565300 [Oryza sativa Japonica Group]|uniref:Os11g0565300 protein n=1 Tax=Oryza sativa subsp. japonica TaxID=39947 RepID=A0A0P0Y3K9_ORYSJ|nr:Os11g0565300 [Oryza sativa Japonica Group]
MACPLLTGKKLLSSLLVVVSTTLTLKHTAASTSSLAFAALPGCPDKCGNVSMPYPFGTIDGCFRGPPFRVYCEDDHAVYLQEHKKLKVLRFELAQGEVLIQKRIATSCGVNLTGKAVGIPWVVHDGGLADDYPYLTISTKNQFAVVGCGITAIIVGQGENQPDYTVGCRSFCDDVDSNIVEDNSTQCNGNTGCCQASIPGNLKAFQPSFLKISGVNYSGVPCVYAFVVEQNWFKFKTSYAKSMELYSKLRTALASTDLAAQGTFATALKVMKEIPTYMEAAKTSMSAIIHGCILAKVTVVTRLETMRVRAHLELRAKIPRSYPALQP